jgi:tRNA U55 pseudouridine synthase TruB
LLNHQTLSRLEIAKIALAKIETIPPVTDIRKALGNDFRRPDVRKAWGAFTEAGSLTDQFSIAKIRCLSSSGTYMRTLAEVIAKQVGSQGLAFSIKRTKVGHYHTETGWSELR